MMNYKRAVTIALISGSIGFANVALAGSSSGPVTNLIVNAGNRILFKAGTATGAPACATVANEYALDASSAVGKAMYAELLTAKALGSNVVVSGTGTCSVQSDRESVQWIKLAD